MTDNLKKRWPSRYSYWQDVLQPPILLMVMWGFAKIIAPEHSGEVVGYPTLGVACGMTLVLLLSRVVPNLPEPEHHHQQFSPGKLSKMMTSWRRFLPGPLPNPTTKQDAFAKAISTAIYSLILSVAFWFSLPHMAYSWKGVAVPVVALSVVLFFCRRYYHKFKQEPAE